MQRLETLCLDEPATPRWVRITPYPDTGTAYIDINFDNGDRILIDIGHSIDITDQDGALDAAVLNAGALLISYEVDSEHLPLPDSVNARYCYQSHTAEDEIGNEHLVAEYIRLADGYRQDTQQTAWHLNNTPVGIEERHLLVTNDE